MGDFKSKLPDFQELTKFTSKLFNDVKKSVCEIMDDYKKKRAESEGETSAEPKAAEEAKPTTKAKAKKTDDEPSEPRP